MKRISILILMIVMSYQSLANQAPHPLKNNTSILLGNNTFSSNYERALSIVGSKESIGASGLGHVFSIGYLHAESKNTLPNLTMVPLLAEAIYYVSSPTNLIQPYIAGGFAIYFLSSDFDSPLLGYRARIGAKITPSGNHFFALDIQTQSVDESKNNITIQPFTISLGMGITFDQQKNSKKNHTKKHRGHRKGKRHRGYR